MIIITKTHQLPKELQSFLDVSALELRECIIDAHESFRQEDAFTAWKNMFKVKLMDAYNDPEVDQEERYIMDQYCKDLYDILRTWITDQKHVWLMASSYPLTNLILEPNRFIYEYGEPDA